MRRDVTMVRGVALPAIVVLACLPDLGALAEAGAFQQNPNRTLASAYRCDLVGPDVWTASAQGAPLDGSAESYWRGEVPFFLVGKPAPGLSGQLHVAHQVKGVKDSLVPEIDEVTATGGARRLSFVPVRNHWTPSFMTTYYRSEPIGLSVDEGSRIGATVLKETKAILKDNTFIAEAVIKNTLSEPRRYIVRISVHSGLPQCGGGAREWLFTAVYMCRDSLMKTHVAVGASFSGSECEVDVSPHGETTFRYALAFAPDDSGAADRRLARALSTTDPFAENERVFNSWFDCEVPALKTSDPELYGMYCYRWFVAKRNIHFPRRVVADHPYPRAAAYESPVGDWFNCVIGLPVPVQLRELRWLRNPDVVRAHALNWCDKIKGYRGYIQFTGESIARIQENHPSVEFARRAYPAVREYALETCGGDSARLPVQHGSWGTGAEYQPNFYQFTNPPWDYRHDAQFGPKQGFPIARSIRLDTACYAVGNLLGAARLARRIGLAGEADRLERISRAKLDTVLARHWDDSLGLFLAADPDTYRLSDKSPCYDSFAPYLWGLVNDISHLRAFDKFVDRAWFWDDFPGTTCAKGCPMYYGANGIVFHPVATPSHPLPKECCWNGPMWHYANTLYAEALGQAARIRADLRPKWVEFFRAWSESHWAYGDRTVPRAAEHFRPEDGTRCGSAWDYFHSAWIDPFILYWCGASLSDGFEKLRFDPYTNEDFRLSGVPFVGRCYTFSQKTDESGRRVRTIFDADGRVLAVGEGALEVMLP